MTRERPFISIVIPTYNRSHQLMACLVACSRLDYPRDCFEVIVVDDGGAESLDAAIREVQGRLTVRLLRQNNAGPAAARNHGAGAAKGEWLVFTDDDCEPASDWLNALAERFVARPDDAVGGRTLNALTRNLYSTTSQLVLSYMLEYDGAIRGRVQFSPSCNVAFPAKRFLDIGGFDTSFPRSAGEDRELCDRWQQQGHGMIHAPEAIVYHSHHLTAKTFLRQHFHYGCGAYHYHLLRAQRLRQPMTVQPLAFYVKMLTYPVGRIPFRKALAVMPLLIIAQAVNAVGFFWELARRKGTGGGMAVRPSRSYGK
ncbi:MAG TPA: glycosyltransferase [Nitrospira sp.]|nr:glycosyltransferase [Nitrospira sp.]